VAESLEQKQSLDPIVMDVLLSSLVRILPAKKENEIVCFTASEIIPHTCGTDMQVDETEEETVEKMRKKVTVLLPR